jgi:hypothetical protein
MTVLSQVNAEQFAAHARFVFPEDVFFDPIEYLDRFNSGRVAAGLVPLAEHTFKKYVAIVCDTETFPGLSRARNHPKASYEYFVDSGENGAAGEVKKKSSPSAGNWKTSPLTSPVSKKSLRRFMRRVVPLMHKGHNPVRLLRQRYNRKHRPLKKGTFSYYMSLVHRYDIWEGLSRRRGKEKSFEYRCDAASKPQRKSPLPIKTAPDPSASPNSAEKAPNNGDAPSSWVYHAQCGTYNPEDAKFCMECGGSLGVYVRAVLQERVLKIPFASSREIREEPIAKWVATRLVVSLSEEDNGYCAVVDIKEDMRG